MTFAHILSLVIFSTIGLTALYAIYQSIRPLMTFNLAPLYSALSTTYAGLRLLGDHRKRLALK